jgi:E3 ubiquitin-protein ligase HUWE1
MLPGDFAVSIASDSLSYLFRLISEVNSATTIKIILKRLRVALENASDFLDNDSPKGMIVDFIDLKGYFLVLFISSLVHLEPNSLIHIYRN